LQLQPELESVRFKKVNYFPLKKDCKNARSIKEAKKMQVPEVGFWYAPQS
jgi:hypothetical protein